MTRDPGDGDDRPRPARDDAAAGPEPAADADEAYPSGRSPFRPKARRPLLHRTIPVAADLQEYRSTTLRRDAVAGITVAALAIPSSMAFAELAGLPAVAGLYGLLLPTLAYVLAGSSKRLMIGPEGATAAMTGAAVLSIADADPERAAGAAAALALLVGFVFLAARLVRLGWLADYFSRPVLIGYIHGVAVVLLVGQLGKVTGVSIDADQALAQLSELVDEGDTFSAATLAVGTVSLAVLFLLRWRAPKIPAGLVVVLGAIAVSAGFDLSSHGVETIGRIPSGLPSLSWPGIRLDELDHLLPAAVGIFAVSFADSILTARSYAGKHKEHVSANQELLAFGLVSIAAGTTQAFPASSSGSRTAVADGTGSRTQIAALVSMLTVGVVLLFLTAPIRYLPMAALGAVIIHAAIGLIEPQGWRTLADGSRRELLIAAITTIGVITVGILPALLVAVALSILDVVTRSARPHDAVLGYVPRLGRWADVRLHPGAAIEPGIVVYRLDDRLFYANVNYVKGRIREALEGAPDEVTWVVFDAESLVSVDSTGIEALGQLIAELADQGVRFAVARARGHVVDLLESSGVADRIGHERIYPTVRAAVAGTSGSAPP